jgi:hypothetical protein
VPAVEAVGEALVAVDLLALGTEPSQPAVYDRPIGLRLLHRDPRTGAEHWLVRYPPGLVERWHRHTAAHTVVVLEGALDVDGVRVGTGGWCHFPAGSAMHHVPADGAGCAFVTVFDGPFDVEPV